MEKLPYPAGKPWENKPLVADGNNFRDLTDKEIEELSIEELCYIVLSFSEDIPKDHEELIKLIIDEKNGKKEITEANS